MSKMDRMLNSKKDKQTIYEIYRACRLCGAGAGYKMPIIQNVIDVDDNDVELKQKIRECVQIEVDQDDKMPPLICELCVDKVNDFYEFLEMCRQTNKRTRLRLGLPPQSMPRGVPDAGDCILGLTEPVFVNEDSDGEPLAKHKKLNPKVKVKKEPELRVKLENKPLTETRSSRHKGIKRPPTPPRMTRHGRTTKDDNVSLSRMQDKSVSSTQKASPRSILKRESKIENTSLLTPRSKRPRDKEPVKLETPVKKVKIAVKSSPSPKSSPKLSPRINKAAISMRPSPRPSPKPSPKPSPRPSPRPSLKPSPKRPPSPPPRTVKCKVCGQLNKTSQGSGKHMRTHVVNFTSQKMACNPCGLWFPTAEEAASHHKYHKSKSKPYNCRRCTADFKHLSTYDDHFENNQCIPWDEVPDVKCDVCWHLFPTNNLLDKHKCLGEEHRPGGKCNKCNRSYTLLRNLKKHEPTCTAKKKGELIINPVLLSKVKPIQVRVSRCDPLLSNIKQEHYDISSVTADFGLDKNCVYPYISSVSSLRLKSESDEFGGMVAIKQEIKDEFCSEENYVHWDSEDSESDEEVSCDLVLNPFAKKKRIDTLATLTLKTLFSQRCLGKVPRKRRRVKPEKIVFDTLLGNEEDVTRDINNIIDNLGDDDDDVIGEGGKNDKNEENNVSGDIVDKGIDENGVEKGTNYVDLKSSDDAADKDIGDSVDKKTDIEDKETDIVYSKNIDDVDSKNTDDVDGKNTDDVDGKNTDDVDDKNTEVVEKGSNAVDTADKDVSMVEGKDDEKNVQKDAQNTTESSDKIDIVNNSIEKMDQSNDVEGKKDQSNDHAQKNYQSNDDAQKNDQNDTPRDVCDGNVSMQEEKDITSTAKTINDDNNPCSDDNGSNNNLGSNSNDKNNDLMRIDDKVMVNNGSINDISVNNNDSEVVNSKIGADSKLKANSAVESNDGNQNVSDSERKNNYSSTKNDIENDKNIESGQDSNSVGTFNESLLNDSIQSDVVSEKEKDLHDNFINDNATSLSEINENKSLDALDNASRDSKMSEIELNLSESKTNDSSLQNKEDNSKQSNYSREDKQNSDEGSIESNKKKAISVIVNSGNTKYSTDSEEIDDSKLMADLNAEIGESNDSHAQGNENFNDKIAIEDLISAKNTEKGMDLDLIPDEYSFDN